MDIVGTFTGTLIIVESNFYKINNIDNAFLAMMHIYVESRGSDDPGGRYAAIKLNGVDFAKNTRGFNIVVVDRKTGRYFPN